MGWALQLQALTRSYGPYRALKAVDLDVRKGQHVAILGPNGAGKTTLLKAIGSLLRPTSGNVIIEGLNLRDHAEEVRQRIGVVTHSTLLYGRLTVYENLDFYARLYGVADRRRRIDQVLSSVGMLPRMNDRVESLSRGMQQRVSVARAILHRPSIILLDEPETGLDQRSLSSLLPLLFNRDDGRTVLFATHRIESGFEFCDRFLILVKGVLVRDLDRSGLTPDGLREAYESAAGAST